MEYIGLITGIVGLGGALLGIAGSALESLPKPTKPSYHKEQLHKKNHQRKAHWRRVKRTFHMSADVSSTKERP